MARYLVVLRWWIALTRKPCDCKWIKYRMNMLGPDGCETELAELSKDTVSSAAKAKIEVTTEQAEWLIRKSIAKSRKAIAANHGTLSRIHTPGTDKAISQTD